jgi:hypothetical protein
MMNERRIRTNAAIAIIVTGLLCILAKYEVYVSQNLPSSRELVEIAKASAREGNVELQCSLKSGGAAVSIFTKILNSGKSDIFVFDLLWRLDNAGKTVPDMESGYRFIRGSELRLLWGPAPMPRLKTVAYRNIPYATRVSPGASLQNERTLTSPVKEYNVYFPENPKTKYESAPIDRITVVVQFHENRPNLKTSPVPLDPAALKIATADALDSMKTLNCVLTPVKLEALRRSDEFDRMVMPGETAEPIALPNR